MIDLFLAPLLKMIGFDYKNNPNKLATDAYKNYSNFIKIAREET